MNEKPILFSTPMVRAILLGKKTQTRRVINLKNEHGLPLHYSRIVDRPCPYGKVGDRLWVRETWLKDGEVYLYKADFGKGILSSSWEGHWKPSIHMPKVACRIRLEIVNVRVERLQDISHEDAVAEGCQKEDGRSWGRLGFSQLWDQINKDRGFGWDVNPWVWVLDFKRVER